jgi:RNA recognition motif-containing protein
MPLQAEPNSFVLIMYQEVTGRKIKVNVTESFLPNIDRSAPEPEFVFVDSQYKVYVRNLAKNVTTEVLKNFFSEKGQILSATVSCIPETSKSKGYGFVTFSSEEEVEAAVATFNNAVSFSCIFTQYAFCLLHHEILAFAKQEENTVPQYISYHFCET